MLLPRTTVKKGECEVCDAKDVNLTCHYGSLWMCDSCWQKEQDLQARNQSAEAQQQRIDAYHNSVESRVIEQSKLIDNSISVRTDLFNAATVAILDLKKAIDENPEITNKPYALAETLAERFNHHKAVIFDLQEKIVTAGNEQKAIQQYLNTLANQLRSEEREKLKLADINYQPKPLKTPTVKTIKTTGTSKKTKLDKVELRKWASELGVNEFTLQMVCVSKGVTPEEGAKILRKSLEAAKA